MSDTSIAVAFGAGVLSFLSPCMLPMVPVYVANMAGLSVLDRRTSGIGFRTPLIHALAFVAGFAVVFTALGAVAGLVGFAVGAHLGLLHKISGGMLIFFGVFLLVSLIVPWLNYEKRMTGAFGGTSGYVRSFLTGSAMSLGWTPCVGPVLGGILTLAYDSGTAWQGAYLLMVYSLGLGVPFVVMSLALGPVNAYLKKFGRYTPVASVLGGFMLIGVGVLTYLDRLTWINTLA